MWKTWVQSQGWKDPLEKETATHPVPLPGQSCGWRSLVGYSPWGRRELDTTEQLHFHFSRVTESMNIVKGGEVKGMTDWV